MLKTAFCSLALAVLVTGVAMTSVDAKTKKKVVAAAGCSASALMRDETRFWACQQAAKAAEAKPNKSKKTTAVASAGCSASALMRDETRFWACQAKK